MSTLTDWKALGSDGRESPKHGSPLLYVLIFACALFIGILIFCYAVTKHANPVLIDTNGKPVAADSASSHH